MISYPHPQDHRYQRAVPSPTLMLISNSEKRRIQWWERRVICQSVSVMKDIALNQTIVHLMWTSCFPDCHLWWTLMSRSDLVVSDLGSTSDDRCELWSWNRDEWLRKSMRRSTTEIDISHSTSTHCEAFIRGLSQKYSSFRILRTNGAHDVAAAAPQ